MSGSTTLLRQKVHNPPGAALNISGDCLEAAAQRSTKTGISAILGFKALVFHYVGQTDTATINHYPELNCAAIPVRATSMHGSFTVNTLVSIREGFDPDKLAMAPAGMVEVAPSQAYKDSSAKSLFIQGYSPQQIQDTQTKALAHEPLDRHDQIWREGLARK